MHTTGACRGQALRFVGWTHCTGWLQPMILVSTPQPEVHLLTSPHLALSPTNPLPPQELEELLGGEPVYEPSVTRLKRRAGMLPPRGIPAAPSCLQRPPRDPPKDHAKASLVNASTEGAAVKTAAAGITGTLPRRDVHKGHAEAVPVGAAAAKAPVAVEAARAAAAVATGTSHTSRGAQARCAEAPGNSLPAPVGRKGGTAAAAAGKVRTAAGAMGAGGNAAAIETVGTGGRTAAAGAAAAMGEAAEAAPGAKRHRSKAVMVSERSGNSLSPSPLKDPDKKKKGRGSASPHPVPEQQRGGSASPPAVPEQRRRRRRGSGSPSTSPTDLPGPSRGASRQASETMGDGSLPGPQGGRRVRDTSLGSSSTLHSSRSVSGSAAATGSRYAAAAAAGGSGSRASSPIDLTAGEDDGSQQPLVQRRKKKRKV